MYIFSLTSVLMYKLCNQDGVVCFAVHRRGPFSVKRGRNRSVCGEMEKRGVCLKPAQD